VPKREYVEVGHRGDMRSEIRIPIRPVSWNTLARKSRWTYKETFEAMKVQTMAAVMKTKPYPRFTGQVKVRFIAAWKDKRKHDLDNVCVKPILDELVSMKVLTGDDMDVMTEVVIRGNRSKEESLTVIIESI